MSHSTLAAKAYYTLLAAVSCLAGVTDRLAEDVYAVDVPVRAVAHRTAPSLLGTPVVAEPALLQSPPDSSFTSVATTPPVRIAAVRRPDPRLRQMPARVPAPSVSGPEGQSSPVLAVAALQQSMPPVRRLPMRVRPARLSPPSPSRRALTAQAPTATLTGTANVEARPHIVAGDTVPVATRDLKVQVGRFVTLDTDKLSAVAVADPAVADVNVLSTTTVLITGIKPGTTSLVIRDAAGTRQYTVTVESPTLVDAPEVEKAINLPTVSVRTINDSIVLEGQVGDEREHRRATEIAAIYSEKVVDLLTIAEKPEKIDFPELAAKISEAIDLPGVTVQVIRDTAILKGEVANEEQKADAETAAAAVAAKVVNMLRVAPVTVEEVQRLIANDAVKVDIVRDWVVLSGQVASKQEADDIARVAALSGKQVISKLTVPPTPEPPPPPPQPSPEEVLQRELTEALNMPTVKVKVTADRQIILTGTVSTDIESQRAEQVAKGFSDKVTNLLVAEGMQQVRVEMKIVEISHDGLESLGFEFPPLNSEGGAATFGETTVNGPVTRLTPFQAALQAFAQDKDVHLLSAPSATVLSGKNAHFVVGGEIPIPSQTYGSAGQGGGILSQSVDWREFGIMMDITPTVDHRGNVVTKIKAEISDIDINNGTNIGGAFVPAFSSRTSETEVYVRNGETIVMSGLIKTRDQEIITKVPLLGDVPILGELFKSKRFQRRETELAIFVTPRSGVTN